MINLNGINNDADIGKKNFNKDWYKDFSINKYLSMEEIHKYIDDYNSTVI